MTEIVFRKRQGREGEMGLFIETQVFEDEWTSIKIGSEVKAVCTVPANLRYVKFFHALCGKVAENCDWLIDKDDAKERILLEARHYKTIHDPLRNKTEIKAKSVAGLSGDQWIRLLRRCTHVVVTKFIPGMDDGPLRAEIEAMIGIDTVPADAPAAAKPPRATRAKKTNPEPVSQAEGGDESAGPDTAASNPSGSGPRPSPTNEAEYLASARKWISQQSNHQLAVDYLDSEAQVTLRAACKLSVGANKMIRRELAEHFEKLKGKTDVRDQATA